MDDQTGSRVDKNRSRHRSAAARCFAVLRFLAAWIERRASSLDPGYFALVMATGIVSNAFFLQGERVLSDALLAVNLVAYPWLWLLTLLRAAASPAAFRDDLLNPRRVFLFFTAVAATDVLGMSVALRGFANVALILWLLALALWLGLIYLGFGVLMFRNNARVADPVEGGWLNAIVGTQSLVIVGGAVALKAAGLGPQAFIVLYMLWTIGLVLYGILVTLLCYRFFYSALAPDHVAPPLWVLMGAAAISVNAGCILILDGDSVILLRSLQPFLDAVTLAAWAWATWWIPLLLMLGIWKHGIHRIPLGYTPALWSMVFPLGMYAVASYRLAGAAGVPALASLSSIMVWVALAAWCATAGGLLLALRQSARALIGYARLFAGEAGTSSLRVGR